MLTSGEVRTLPPPSADRTVIALAFLSFALLGIPGGVLNVGWSPAIRSTFGLQLPAVGVLLLASTLGYAAASFVTGRLMRHLGPARLLVACAVVSALGATGMALAPSWPVMVGFGLLLGSGGGLLDGAMNIYFAANYGPRLMNWLHASFGVGATVAPLAMTAIFRYGGSWRLGYGLGAGLYAWLAVLFALTARHWRLASAAAASSTAPAGTASVRETLRLPLVWLGIALFLTYTGLEVSAGQWAFSLLTDARHVAPVLAGVWVSIYWGSFTVGRILFGFVVQWVRPVTLIRACLAGAVMGALLLGAKWLGGVSFLGLALFGFCLAPIFALMISGTPERLGPAHAPNAIGFQVGAAALGVGILPGLAGVLAKNHGLEVIPWFLLGAVVVISALFETIQRWPSQGRKVGG